MITAKHGIVALLIGLAASFLQVVASPQAQADHCYEVEQAHMSHGQIITTVVLVCPDHSSTGGQQTVDPVVAPPPVGSAACLAAAGLLGLPPDEVCGGSDDEVVAPVITDALVARALRQLDLPASALMIQPPGGRTLVNFQTNFFTTNDQPFTRSLSLLGRTVELRIWPTNYTWHFGDGNQVTTASPGARFPNLDVTHNYLEKGAYRPAVETTYAAEWRVGDGPWRTVEGSATIAGTPANLRAVEATPTLVGY